MLYREIMAVCSEIHIKHINTVCGLNVEFVNVKPGGTHNNRWNLKGLINGDLERMWKEAIVVQLAKQSRRCVMDLSPVRSRCT